MKNEVLRYLEKCFGSKIHLEALTGDAGNRQYFEIKADDQKIERILCLYDPNELQSFDAYLNVSQLFENESISVPQIIDHKRDLCLMILEDLGRYTLEDAYCKTQNLNMHYAALDEMIRIQSTPKRPGSYAHSYAFDVTKFNWELNFAVEQLSELFSLKISTTELKHMNEDFTKISTELCKLPQVLTHRDYHSRNILIHNERPYIIDFQDARMGNPFYDLVSLVEDTYVQIESKNQLIHYYLENSSLNLLDDFEVNYNTQAFQRSLKACGSFASLKNLKNSDRYLKYLMPSLMNINAYLKNLDGMGASNRFINICIEKMRNFQHD